MKRDFVYIKFIIINVEAKGIIVATHTVGIIHHKCFINNKGNPQQGGLNFH